MTKEQETVLACADAMVRKIESTKKTDPEIFEECGKYIKAAGVLLDPKSQYSASDKRYILTVQMLALELVKSVPYLINKIVSDIDKLPNEY